MKYVDGFVVAVPAENKEAYREWSSAGRMMSRMAS